MGLECTGRGPLRRVATYRNFPYDSRIVHQPSHLYNRRSPEFTENLYRFLSSQRTPLR